jgi:hypothetical protein
LFAAGGSARFRGGGTGGFFRFGCGHRLK